MADAETIWINGEFVAWEDAKVHVLTHALHYGTGVFEGIRAYETPRGTAVFRHGDHIERLFKSAELYYMEIPYSREELRTATHELIARNGLKSCYIRPLVFRGASPMGLYSLDCPVEVAIAVWEWGAYLGDEGKQRGVRGKVSSWRRIGPDALIPAAKATGQYLNSVLAKIEADKAGYEEGILLDQRGMVCEGTGENLFVVKDGRIATPGFSSSILGGINRLSAIEIARDLGYEVQERDIARGELYMADEIFMTGTAAELTPLREIDDHPVGSGQPGEVTREVQNEFEDALHGRSERYAHWLDVVPAPAGHAEGAHVGLQPLVLEPREQLGLLRVGGREAGLDERDPEVVEDVRHPDLLVHRQRHPLPLHPVAQGGVVDGDAGHGAGAA